MMKSAERETEVTTIANYSHGNESFVGDRWICAGDAAAFDSLYARHKGGVYRYLARQCRQSGIADELFQDVWMNLIRARASYAPTAKFTTWLYRLAHNRMIDHYRASGHLTLVSSDDEAHEHLTAVREIPTASFLARGVCPVKWTLFCYC